MGRRWLLVAGDFAPYGGMDTANLALARYLADTGAGVELVAHGVAPELAVRPTVRVRRVPRPFGSHLFGEPLLDAAGRRAAGRLDGPMVVVNGGNCRWADVCWVHYVHAGHPPTVAGPWPRRAKAAFAHRRAVRREREIVPRCRVVVANSRRTAHELVERMGVPGDRVRVVYYGTDPARFGPISPAERTAARARLGWPTGRPVVGFVGALGDRRKRFDTLYAAWADLCRDPRWDADLAVIGAGAELPAWRARAAADGLAGRVRFLGFRTNVPDLLAGLDAVAHPAGYEPFGLGVQEAVCRGLPAVVSAAAGVTELLPAEWGPLLLPDPDDAVALADALRAWRRDPDGWAGRVRPVADRLRCRTWGDMAAEFVAAVTPG